MMAARRPGRPRPWMLDRRGLRRSPSVSCMEYLATSRVDRQLLRQNNKPMANAVKRADSDWRQLYPFESHWHKSGSGLGRMHYVDEGPTTSRNGAPPDVLLFVHGNPTWSFHWRR